MADKANHHFIPQFYLRNFSGWNDKRKARVFCFDQSTGKSFETLVRNVGSRRHFFRINTVGLDPNLIEDAMAAIEGDISIHFAEVSEMKMFPSGEHFSSLMNLIANLAVRNPRFRSKMEKFHLQVISNIIKMCVKNKNRFEQSIKNAQDHGVLLREGISYDELKHFVDKGEYILTVDQTYLIRLELEAAQTVYEQLVRRSWSFVSPPPGSTYITSDDPVVLDWLDGGMKPYSPGFGLGSTMVILNLSPELSLIGLFMEQPKRRTHSREQVTAVNTSIARFMDKQIYARDGSFEIHVTDEPFVRGYDLPNILDRHKRRHNP
jgi:hypothetical protein